MRNEDLDLRGAGRRHTVTSAEVASDQGGVQQQSWDPLATFPGTIRTAVGIIMVTEHVDVEEAFLRLATLSQDTRRKLRDVAAEVVGSIRGSG